METAQLTQKKCTPCEGNESPLTRDQMQPYLSEVSDQWKVIDNSRIHRNLEFKDFAENMEFVNKIADLAEEEGHHPDLYISYSQLEITLSTHAIGGLSENDFILAAKIEELLNDNI